MTLDPVPWFIGGGAQHSPEVARLLAFAGTSGAEGIVTPGDLKVVPLDVPGSSIKVLAGAGLVLNKAAGGSQQTYVVRNPSEEVKGISATGSGAGRSDLIVIQIKDPFMPGEPWADPADVTQGPYVFVTVVSNVSPTTTTVPAGMSGIALARIDLPSNTGTITAGMIKDLRKLAQPRSTRWLYSQSCPAQDFTFTGGWQTFPNVVPQVEVPSWATHADMRVDLSGLFQINKFADAEMRAHIGNSQVSGPMGLDNDGWSDGIRHAAIITCGGPLLQSERGQLIQLKVMTQRIAWNDGVHTGYYRTDGSTHIGFDIQFSEKTV